MYMLDFFSKFSQSAGLFFYDDLTFECFRWMASEKRPSALQHQHRELMQRLQTYHAAECCISSPGPLTSACEAHLSLATALINAFWMGPLLTSKWVRKQNSVRFTLLFWALLCGEDKATTLHARCEGTMMAVHGAASARGQASDVRF